jgi:hypothetical protein
MDEESEWTKREFLRARREGVAAWEMGYDGADSRFLARCGSSSKQTSTTTVHHLPNEQERDVKCFQVIFCFLFLQFVVLVMLQTKVFLVRQRNSSSLLDMLGCWTASLTTSSKRIRDE